MSYNVEWGEVEFDILNGQLQVAAVLPFVFFNMVAYVERLSFDDPFRILSHVKGNGMDGKSAFITLV